MKNLNVYRDFSGFQPKRLSKDKPNNCSGNCQAKIKGLTWLGQQKLWTYQCKCCQAYQFELGLTKNEEAFNETAL